MNHIAHATEKWLTTREEEILSFIADGLSSRQIAIKLYISKNTVDNHRRNMLRKAGVKSSAELCVHRYKQFFGINNGY